MDFFYLSLLFFIFMIFLNSVDGSENLARRIELRVRTREPSRSPSPGPDDIAAYNPARLDDKFRQMRMQSPTNQHGIERYPLPRRDKNILFPSPQRKTEQYISQMHQILEQLRSFTPRTNRAGISKSGNNKDTPPSPYTPGGTRPVLDHNTIQSARRSLDLRRDHQLSSSQSRMQQSRIKLIKNDKLMGIGENGSKCVGIYRKFTNETGRRVEGFFTLESLKEGSRPQLATILPYYVMQRDQVDIYERTEDNSGWQELVTVTHPGQRS